MALSADSYLRDMLGLHSASLPTRLTFGPVVSPDVAGMESNARLQAAIFQAGGRQFVIGFQWRRNSGGYDAEEEEHRRY